MIGKIISILLLWNDLYFTTCGRYYFWKKNTKRFFFLFFSFNQTLIFWEPLTLCRSSLSQDVHVLTLWIPVMLKNFSNWIYAFWDEFRIMSVSAGNFNNASKFSLQFRKRERQRKKEASRRVNSSQSKHKNVQLLEMNQKVLEIDQKRFSVEQRRLEIEERRLAIEEERLKTEKELVGLVNSYIINNNAINAVEIFQSMQEDI